MPIEAVVSPRTAVTGAIRAAADATGVSFDYLLATAKVESSLNPGLTARSSSATGLFQFVDQTWLATLKQAGPALGYGNYADAITKTPSGRYEVADPALRREIMALRKEAGANAAMAGAFTQQNAAELAKRIGRAPSEGELYIAHFFGSHGGAKLINRAASNPSATAADVFPAAARANRSIFYDRQGGARSIAGVYAELVRRYRVARAESSPTPTRVAAASPPPPVPPAPVGEPVQAVRAVRAAVASPKPVASPARVPAALAFADSLNMSHVLSAAGNQPPAAAPPPVLPSAPAEQAESRFHSLFHTAGRRGAVSPVVAALWGGKPAQAHKAVEASPAPKPPGLVAAPAQGSTLDLFRDMAPNVRALFDGTA
jgi:hypothetical protein